MHFSQDHNCVVWSKDFSSALGKKSSHMICSLNTGINFAFYITIQLLTSAWTVITRLCFFLGSRTLCSTMSRRGIGAGARAFLLSISTCSAAFSPVSKVAPASVYYNKLNNNWREMLRNLLCRENKRSRLFGISVETVKPLCKNKPSECNGHTTHLRGLKTSPFHPSRIG